MLDRLLLGHLEAELAEHLLVHVALLDVRMFASTMSETRLRMRFALLRRMVNAVKQKFLKRA